MKKIPPFKLEALPLNKEAENLQPFMYAGKEIGNRHRLGGSPENTDPMFLPKCKECNENMSYYGQFDSINDEFIIGDCFVIEVYYCFDCVEAFAQVVPV